MDAKNYRFAALGLAQISYPREAGFSASAPISRAVHGMDIHGMGVLDLVTDVTQGFSSLCQ